MGRIIWTNRFSSIDEDGILQEEMNATISLNETGFKRKNVASALGVMTGELLSLIVENREEQANSVKHSFFDLRKE